MSTPCHEILFIDANISNIDTLLAGLSQNIDVVILDDKMNALDQIDAALRGYKNLDAIHIMSHGAEGELVFAKGVLSHSNITSYATQLKRIGSALSATGDLLLYGCDVAKGENGLAFINALSTFAAADVAASDDLTGAKVLGGDWVLEKNTGKIQTLELSPASFQSVLAAKPLPAPGVVITDLGSNTDYAKSVDVQPDGKILVGGSGNGYVTLARYNSNGSLDVGFGTKGIVKASTGSATAVHYLTSVYPGKIVVATTQAVSLFDSNGILDRHFESYSRYPYAKGIFSADVAIQTVKITGGYSNYLLVVGGTAGNYNNLTVARHFFSGPYDTTFSGGDSSSLGMGVNSFIIQADGKILTAGYRYFYNDLSGTSPTSQWSLHRFNSDGSTDLSWYNTSAAGYANNGGNWNYDFGGFNQIAQSILLQPDGKVLVVGTVQASIDNILHSYFTLIRFSSNGLFDTSFGTVMTDFFDPTNQYQVNVSKAVLQLDGKIVVVGTKTYTTGNSSIVLARYNSDGSLDQSFGVDGIVTSSQANGAYLANSVTAQSDGKIVVVGSFNNSGNTDFLLIRYNSDGSIDSTFNIDNVITGDSGNNTLNGGEGIDTLIGGLGNDTYVVDSTTDTIKENVNQGIDVVQSSVSFTLAINIENLVLLGNTAIVGTGNQSNNIIAGNSADNTLNGGAGVDTLIGGLGNDTYVVDSAKDTLTENLNEGIDTVESSVIYTLPTNFENLTLTGTSALAGTGNSSHNVIVGNSGNNTLAGLDGDDTLDGGAGRDTLIGGLGNDSYFVDNSADVVRENANEGIDTIQSTVSYTLLTNFENLILTGTSAIAGTGNSSDNVIVGNNGNNSLIGLNGDDTLDGGAGNDTLMGALGNDTYVVDSAFDTLTENVNEGTDLVQSSVNFTLPINIENLNLISTSAITGIGNTSHNVMIGNTADNTLDGGAGNDTLMGGLGNDTYVVDSTADSVIEIANEGTDLVQSSVSIMLPMNIENLILLGNTVMTAMGNDSNNVMTGNTADNTLDGGAGNDTLIGGLGNDTYVVDSSADSIIENVNEGTDLAQSSVNFTLPTNIENLNLVGTSVITGTGNLSNNIMIGNTADNTLDGGLGSDSLIGGLGNDLYIVDNIADFLTENANQGIDTVQSSVSYTLNSNIENLTLIGDLGNTGIGNALDNILTGNSASNTLSGLGGHDTIYGMGGDTLIGGFGADRLIAEGDKNTLQGDAGNDTFVFSNFLFTNNTIVDFVKGDRMEIVGYGAVNTIVSGTGDNVKQGVIEYSLDGINTILYLGVDDKNGADATITINNLMTPNLLTVVENTIYINSLPTGSVAILGKVIQGEVLTASNNLADEEGLGTLSYQWLSNGLAILGATGETYTLTQTEVGKTISVQASYTDLLSTVERVTSLSTNSVVNVNDLPLGLIVITGTATQGQVLTVSNTLSDLDGLGTISYQWLSNGSAILGAVGETYTLTQTEVGKTISVQASYTDLLSTVELITSAQTSTVAAASPVSVSLNATSTSSIATAAAEIFNITSGNYAASIAGFGVNDKLVFAAGTAKSLTNASYTDGNMTVQGTLNNQIVTIQLTGISATLDAQVDSLASFNTVFGTGSLI
ncbi:MAG: hypothetical protein RLZZ66_1315 [Pseudomonadota bacterium]